MNLNVGIFIDKGDQGPGDKSVHSVCLMIVPFAGGDYFGHGARVRVTIGFRRASDIERRVRVMVGCDGHCTAVGLSAFASFRGNLTVREICLNSTV